jgi:hypothetical protein
MQSIKQTEGYHSLDQAGKDLVTRLQRDQDQLREALAEHTERIILQQDYTNERITAEHEQTRKILMQSSYENQTLRKLDGIQRAIDDENATEEQKKTRLIEALLLANLSYSTMADRFDGVEPAHRKTYEWIFRSPDSRQARWADFPRWLAEGAGIYWITGKPASGKSTLMRFICDDSRTTALLEAWTKSKRLITSTHFFWNSGTGDQRSYSGLLRALLFKILKQSQHLIRKVFPTQWAERQQYPLKAIQELAPESWTLSKLTQAFELLFQEADDGVRFFLVVDGLDEYDGDPFDMTNIFTRLSKLPNVKLCLSSRPLYDFVQAFRSFPSLRLQDLTFNDIKQYVDDELRANSLMKELQLHEPEKAPKLVLEIVEKADGVFLWVKLVVLSLIRGLRNSDQISDLQKRLRLLPPSLEELFSHVLGRLEPVYLEQSSRIFQIFSAARLMEQPLSSIELSFAEEEDAQKLIQSQTQIISETELASRRASVEMWLQTRCGGLIETHIPQNAGGNFNSNLSYLHRTVRDFLELPGVWSRVSKPTKGTGFSPHLSLLKSGVLYMKLVLSPRFPPSPIYGGPRAIPLGRWNVMRACRAEIETGRTEFFILEELDKECAGIVHKLLGWIAPPVCWASAGLESWLAAVENPRGKRLEAELPELSSLQGHGDNFLSVAVRAGLHQYVGRKLELDPNFIRKPDGRPLIFYAVEESTGLSTPFNLSARMIQLLLHHGACPNEVYEAYSAWDVILERLVQIVARWEKSDWSRTELLKIVRLFLQHGANPRQKIFGHSGMTVSGVITGSFQIDFPEETRELQQLLKSLDPVDDEETECSMIKSPLQAQAGELLTPMHGPMSQTRASLALESPTPKGTSILSTTPNNFREATPPQSTGGGTLKAKFSQLSPGRRRKWFQKLYR